MCGILGSWRPSGARATPDRFTQALDRLAQRGPDASAVWSDASVQLGHRRLAIVDLSPAGEQPMVSADKRYVIVFNGEIYNHMDLRARIGPLHTWRGTSDTETLLECFRLWGPACLERLNGMFAFAIWDSVERRLFLARDRMGVKPLYFRHQNGELDFASRPNALTTLAPGTNEFDPQAVRLYLELGYIPAPLSLYRNVRKLRPGHYLTADASGVREVRYWDFRHIEPDRSLVHRREDDLVDELLALVHDSVRVRLMSDVPLGAFLSGGVDSALVVASMKAVGVSTPSTFTIGFAEERFNEAPAAARIAAHVGTEHHTEIMSVNGLTSMLSRFVDEFDEPLSDSSAFPTMAVARLARTRVTVCLSGDGGDELFGGYPYYGLTHRIARLQGLPPIAVRALRNVSRRIPVHRAKLLSGALDRADIASLYAYLRGVSKDYPDILDEDVRYSTADTTSWFSQVATSFALDLSGAETGMRLDASLTLPDQYLQKVDVATMAFSLEARCPFMDYRLVEWAMRLPVEWKLRRGETKYLLKRAACRHLPASAVYQPKKGFGVPVGRWLRGPLRGWAETLLNDRSLLERLPIDGERVRQLFRSHVSGERDAYPILWGVLMMLCFVARHDRAMPLPTLAKQNAA